MYGEITLRENINETEVEKQIVFADVSSITQSEYVAAGQKDIKPSYKFVIWSFEYNNQTEAEYNGQLLTVYRTYSQEGTDKIELYTEKRAGKR